MRRHHGSSQGQVVLPALRDHHETAPRTEELLMRWRRKMPLDVVIVVVHVKKRVKRKIQEKEENCT